MLLRLEERELKDLGMENSLHVKRFLVEQDKLRRRAPGPTSILSSASSSSSARTPTSKSQSKGERSKKRRSTTLR